MNNDELSEKLNAEISKTEILIAEYEELTKPIAPDDSIGRVSRMDAINNRSITEAALRQSKEKLHRLKYVLTKIGEPDFGLCMKCQAPIPIGRILIRPESVYCVNCAT